MKTDNQWHDGIFYKLEGGDFVLKETIEEAMNDARPKEMENGAVKFQPIRYNWNRGEPIVDFGEFKMSIVDRHESTTPRL